MESQQLSSQASGPLSDHPGDAVVSAADVVRELSARSLTVATAESLTAGLCAATLASVPGASAVLRGGLIVYATELKARLAGVDDELLRDRGPIDPDVAEQLARGAADKCGADVGVGLTGVAGPDPQDGHDIGEVYVGVWFQGVATHRAVDVSGIVGAESSRRGGVATREKIRRAAVDFAFRVILETVTG